jgi:hypothetical protein
LTRYFTAATSARLSSNRKPVLSALNRDAVIATGETLEHFCDTAAQRRLN